MRQPTLDEALDVRDDEDIRQFVDRWKEILARYKSKGRSETEQSHKFWIDMDILFTGKFDPKTDLDFEKLTLVTGDAPAKGEADVYSPRYHFLAEQKSAGIDLDAPEKRQQKLVTPFRQAVSYLDRLSYAEAASIRTIVTSNFEEFRFYPLGENGRFSEGDYISCRLEEMPEKAGLFRKLFSGGEVREQFSILSPEYTDKAAEKVSSFYKALVEGVEANQRLARAKKDEYEKKIPLIVMRVVFLLFADNTSADLGKLFKDNQFTTFLAKSTNENYFTYDLMELFKCLNIDGEEERAKELIPEKLMDFPYVDGGLFEEALTFPEFSKEAYSTLCDLADKFKNWDGIDVSVFGPVMDHVFGGEERRENGIYYTSKENIRKIINPLFMDGLRAEFGEIKKTGDWAKRREKLEEFHDRLSRLQFFDPACGSGNFLTEAFMELRALEDDVIALESPEGHNLDNEIKVAPSQFHGIELKSYAARVARTALQIAREQALEKSYARFYDDVSRAPAFLPLKDDVRGIVCGNALEMDWYDVVTPSKDLYVFGNPPYVGINVQNEEQRKEMEAIFGDMPHSKLDYCAAWFYKAAEFLNGSEAKFAFVSTNSITQGAQAPQAFEPVTDMGWRIDFAYPSFAWDNKGAVVTVCIIGMTQNPQMQPKIWNGEEFEKAENISPYELLNAPTVFVKARTAPISDLLPMDYGSSPREGNCLAPKDGSLEKEAEQDPIIAKYMRPYLGSEELIHNKQRHCLWMAGDFNPGDISRSKFLRERIEAVRQFRVNSKREQTRKRAQIPYEFGEVRQPDADYMAIPVVFSEKRGYFLAGYEDKNTIASNALFTCADPEGFAFSIIESSMFMAWQDLVGGRLKTDNRFSNTLVWNTFPLPKLTEEHKDRIIEGGRKVLEARALYPQSALCDLYNPSPVREELIKAHEALDRAMDRVFSNKPLRSEEERQKALLKAYKEMTKEKEG